MSKVLLSETIHESGIRLLESEAEVIVCPEPTEEAIGSLIKGVDGLIIRTAGKVTREMIQQAGQLKVISRTGGGLNNVDIDAATEHNIIVCGVKGYPFVAVMSKGNSMERNNVITTKGNPLTLLGKELDDQIKELRPGIELPSKDHDEPEAKGPADQAAPDPN